MTAIVARLRTVPAIELEQSEGRLRRRTTESCRNKVEGASGSRPHPPWSQDVYDLQMRAKIAVTLVEETYRNLRALEDLHEISLEFGIEELTFQIYQLQSAAAALQSN